MGFSIKKIGDKRLKRTFFFWASAGVAVILSVLIGFFAYAGVITNEIDARIEQLRSTRVTQFFTFPSPFRINQTFAQSELRAFIQDQGYNEKKSPDELGMGDYAWDRTNGLLSVVLFRPTFDGPGHQLEPMKARLVLEESGNKVTIRTIQKYDTGSQLESFENSPKKVGAFFAGRLRTESAIPLSEIPVSVRLAVMAIEDINFLEHPGVSVRSTARALWRDLRARRFVEGGSTLTQQLMKNLFLTHEKALSRKLKEAIFALVTEARHSKEAILEAYLNEVYMGQWSTHEIHGVSEGARYYFHRPISELSLPQSATLAAIIQAPNTHDPRRFPDRTLKRRNLVLKKMLDGHFIEPAEYDVAVKEPLGVIPSDRSMDDADYFMDLVMQRLPPDIQKRLDTDALTIYVSLKPALQTAASRALKANLERLQKISPSIKAKEKRGIHLESALIAIDVKDCSVVALQGGRGYKQTQFNRVLAGHRQPGSLFKPFVYLAAFEPQPNMPPVTPITEIEDTPFEWKYDNQTWKPRNYDNDYRQVVTVQQALEFSLNVPTARLAQRAGVENILNVMRKAGIHSALPAVPSISLGSAEVTPLELAEAYTTIAGLGKSCNLRPFLEIYDGFSQRVPDPPQVVEQALPPIPTFQTVDLLKGVFTRGTARSALSSGIPLENFAGKTGTTNDYKDAWFIGFSPSFLVLVWVGYDEEEKVGLAGATAALPLWIDFMKKAEPFLTHEDFVPPEGLVKLEIDATTRSLANPGCVDHRPEYFVNGTEPNQHCLTHQ